MKPVGSWPRRNFWMVGGAGIVIGALLALSSGTVGGAIAFTRHGVTGIPRMPAQWPQTPQPPAGQQPIAHYDVVVQGVSFVNTDFAGVSSISSATLNGQTIYKPVTLQRRYMGSDDLTQWRQRIVQSGGQTTETRNVTITYFDAALKPLRSVMLENAWPSGWDLPGMDVNYDGKGTESIRLTFERAIPR